MTRAWEAVVKAAGLGRDVTPHVLRHTYASWELTRGVPPWKVAQRSGMSLTVLLKHYGHFMDEEQARMKA